MAERFSGTRGQELLVQELANSRIVANDTALAGAVAAVGKVISVASGDVIIRQDGDGVFFILDGAFKVLANGREINMRIPRDSVGEMATISMSQRRSATVAATKYSVVLKVDEPDFIRIGDAFPALWRRIAQDLARRLEERNR